MTVAVTPRLRHCQESWPVQTVFFYRNGICSSLKKYTCQSTRQVTCVTVVTTSKDVGSSGYNFYHSIQWAKRWKIHKTGNKPQTLKHTKSVCWWRDFKFQPTVSCLQQIEYTPFTRYKDHAHCDRHVRITQQAHGATVLLQQQSARQQMRVKLRGIEREEKTLFIEHVGTLACVQNAGAPLAASESPVCSPQVRRARHGWKVVVAEQHMQDGTFYLHYFSWSPHLCFRNVPKRSRILGSWRERGTFDWATRFPKRCKIGFPEAEWVGKFIPFQMVKRFIAE